MIIMKKLFFTILFTFILSAGASANTSYCGTFSWYEKDGGAIFEIENNSSKKLSLSLIEIYTSDKKLFYQKKFEFDEKNIESYSRESYFIYKENKIWDLAKTAIVRCVEYKEKTEYQKDLEKRTKEYENSLKNNNSKLYKTNSGRAEALNLLSFKTSTALNGFMGGIIGLIFGIGIYSILDKIRKKKVNDKVFFGVFFFLGWILVKLF